VGVIGLGHMGSRHAKLYANMPGVRLAAVATREMPEHARLPDDAFVTDDYTELAGKVEAVSICTPTILHAEIAEFFMQQGIHVLIEKPMSATTDEARRLVATAESAGVCLMVGHVERFNPAFTRLAALLAQDGFEPGRVQANRLTPFNSRVRDIGVVLDLMVHDIDLALALFPERTAEVRQALCASVVTSRPDMAMAKISLSGEGPSVQVNFAASRVSQNAMREWHIGGPAPIRVDWLRRKLWVKRGKEWEEIPTEQVDPLEQELAHFVACVRSGSDPCVSGADGLRALEVCAEIVDVAGWSTAMVAH